MLRQKFTTESVVLRLASVDSNGIEVVHVVEIDFDDAITGTTRQFDRMPGSVFPGRQSSRFVRHSLTYRECGWMLRVRAAKSRRICAHSFARLVKLLASYLRLFCPPLLSSLTYATRIRLFAGLYILCRCGRFRTVISSRCYGGAVEDRLQSGNVPRQSKR